MALPLLSSEIVDALRASQEEVLKHRARIYFLARGRAPSLFEERLPQIVDEFVGRLIAACSMYVAEGRRASLPSELLDCDQVLAETLVALSSACAAEQRLAATAWELASNFMLLDARAPAAGRGGRLRTRSLRRPALLSRLGRRAERG